MSCGKRRYTSEAQAVRAMAERGLAAGALGGRVPTLRVYECQLCHGYHLTSKPFRPKRRKRRRVA